MRTRFLFSFVLSLIPFWGQAQYSSNTFRLGVENSEITPSPEASPRFNLGLEHKKFLTRFGNENIHLDLGFLIGVTSTAQRIHISQSISDESYELEFSGLNYKDVQYKGKENRNIYGVQSGIYIGPALNIPVYNKLRLNLSMGWGLGVNNSFFSTSYSDGNYTSNSFGTPIKNELNNQAINGTFYDVVNTSGNNYYLIVAHRTNSSVISSVYRIHSKEIGFEYDLTDKLSIGLSFTSQKQLAPTLYKSSATRLKGEMIQYNADEYGISNVQTKEYFTELDDSNSKNYKFFEFNKPDFKSTIKAIKITKYF